MAVKVVVEPSSPRLRPGGLPGYDRLETALREAGFEPTYQASLETRGGELAPALIVLHVGEELAGIVLFELGRVLREWFRSERATLPAKSAASTLRGVIYGPHNEILSEVELHPDD